jgi:hypothetical protein
MTWTPEKSAGVAYVLPTLAAGGIWYTLLFTGGTSGAGPLELLRHVLLEAPERAMFWSLALIPAMCLLLTVAYFLAMATKKVGSIALCGAGVGVAVAAWLTLDWTIATFATLPLLCSVPRAKWHLTTARKD